MTPIKCFLVEKTGEHREVKTGITCDCGKPDCSRTVYKEPLWRRVDSGQVIGTYYDLPPGAMWRAEWYEDHYTGFDGKCYVVMTPAGPWIIDSEASNCTRKGDKTHRCWCREGLAPNLTVSKNGNTCSAGAGSILMTKAGGHKCDFHGFLRGGYLVDC